MINPGGKNADFGHHPLTWNTEQQPDPNQPTRAAAPVPGGRLLGVLSKQEVWKWNGSKLILCWDGWVCTLAPERVYAPQLEPGMEKLGMRMELPDGAHFGVTKTHGDPPR